MAKGDIAKKQVIDKIIEIFGQDKAFVSDKKLYINTSENGQPIQVCISMTCPKVAVAVSTPSLVAAFTNAFDSFSSAVTAAPEAFKPAEITNEERATVMDLMKKLGM